MASAPPLICGAQYTAPLRPGDKVAHVWLCELRAGHTTPHASPSHSISATMAARRFTLAAVIADIPCDDCGRTDGTHDLSVEHWDDMIDRSIEDWAIAFVDAEIARLKEDED